MPLYEYELCEGDCKVCGGKFTLNRPLSAKPLTNVTYRYIELLADHGLADACQRHPAIRGGINVMNGKLTCEAVADAHGLPVEPLVLE